MDGSVEQIRLLPNGEVEANDDYRYRWKVKGNTVQIESWEQRTISPFAPQNALDWFTAKSEVTVLQVRARQDDSEALVLTGPGGSLTKMEDGWLEKASANSKIENSKNKNAVCSQTPCLFVAENL